MSTQLFKHNTTGGGGGGGGGGGSGGEITDTNYPDPPTWFPQQERILQGWAEVASCYRFIHNRCSFSWRRWSIGFSLPIIALSTLTGVGNFAHASFPDSWKSTVPLIIGGINVIVGILGTIQRFLRVDELKEAHYVASIGWAKIARNIVVELGLPPSERSSGGKEYISFCRAEFDRLLEQSPDIHPKVATKFNSRFKNTDIHKPEIIQIYPVEIYKSNPDDESLVLENIAKLRQRHTEVLAKAKLHNPASDLHDFSHDDIFGGGGSGGGGGGGGGSNKVADMTKVTIATSSSVSPV